MWVLVVSASCSTVAVPFVGIVGAFFLMSVLAVGLHLALNGIETGIAKREERRRYQEGRL